MYSWVRGAGNNGTAGGSGAGVGGLRGGAGAEGLAAGSEGLGATNALYDGRRHVGLLAQDVLRALPEAVTAMGSPWRRSVPAQGQGQGQGQGDGSDFSEYLGVSYADVVPLLLEAVKELEVRTRAGAGAAGAGAVGEGEDGEGGEGWAEEEEGYDGYILSYCVSRPGMTWEGVGLACLEVRPLPGPGRSTHNI